MQSQWKHEKLRATLKRVGLAERRPFSDLSVAKE